MDGERQANENTGENENKNKDKNEKEKRLEEMKSILEKQEERLHDLQSTAFQLANFYFVFQGVILGSISKGAGASASACSHKWVFVTLSALAAFVNLLALSMIGLRYKRMLAHQYETQAHCNNLLKELDKLKGIQAHQPESQAQCDARLSEELGMPRDLHREIKHNIYFYFCVLLFLGFAAVTLYGCVKIPCNKDVCTTQLHNDKCLNVCDDVNCIRLCT